MRKARILLVEDDPDFGASFAIILKRKGYEVTLSPAAVKAVNLLKEEMYDLVVSDVVMPDMSGLDFLKAFTVNGNLPIPFIMLTGYGSVKEAVEAMKAGAYSYFLKPVNQDEICLTIEKALEHARLKEENTRLKQEIGQLKGDILPTQNESMKRLLSQAVTVAKSDVNVLITGESGTGKEVIARLIHTHSLRAAKAFIPLNCQAYVDTLIESELFGYKANSFTGAGSKGKQGKVELASGGTLFLDEIGELNMATQVKLLRVLETREIEPIGSVKLVPVNFRLLSATNRDIRKEIAGQRFREDLFYRINTVVLDVPPLRERAEDIIPYARAFLQIFSLEQKKPLLRLTSSAEKALLHYAWPGNIRELRNVIEGAVALAQGSRIEEMDLKIAPSYGQDTAHYQTSYRIARTRFESLYFQFHFSLCQGNISAMARNTKVDRKQLYQKLEALGILR